MDFEIRMVGFHQFADRNAIVACYVQSLTICYNAILLRLHKLAV